MSMSECKCERVLMRDLVPGDVVHLDLKDHGDQKWRWMVMAHDAHWMGGSDATLLLMQIGEPRPQWRYGYEPYNHTVYRLVS